MPATKADPTGTTTIRVAYANELIKRFNWFKRQVVKLLLEEDAFGLRSKTGVVNVENSLQVFREQFRFLRDDQKVQSFNAWMQTKFDEGVLETGTQPPWQAKYVDSAYRKGRINSYIAARKAKAAEGGVPFPIDQEQFVQSAFRTGETVDKLRLLYTRQFDKLQGVTSQVASQLSDHLTRGLLEGKHPLVIAREMSKTIDKQRWQLKRIARTEIIHIHAESQLDSYKELGIYDVKQEAEFMVADQEACQQCLDLSGNVYDLKKARGIIPVHPNCRCSWLPVIQPPSKQKPLPKAESVAQPIKVTKPKVTKPKAKPKVAKPKVTKPKPFDEVDELLAGFKNDRVTEVVSRMREAGYTQEEIIELLKMTKPKDWKQLGDEGLEYFKELASKGRGTETDNWLRAVTSKDKGFLKRAPDVNPFGTPVSAPKPAPALTKQEVNEKIFDLFERYPDQDVVERIFYAMDDVKMPDAEIIKWFEETDPQKLIGITDEALEALDKLANLKSRNALDGWLADIEAGKYSKAIPKPKVQPVEPLKKNPLTSKSKEIPIGDKPPVLTSEEANALRSELHEVEGYLNYIGKDATDTLYWEGKVETLEWRLGRRPKPEFLKQPVKSSGDARRIEIPKDATDTPKTKNWAKYEKKIDDIIESEKIGEWDEVVESIQEYTTEGYDTINYAARTRRWTELEDYHHDQIKILDQLTKTEIDGGITSYRGCGPNTGRKLLEEAEVMLEENKGGYFFDRGFGSTSLDAETAASFTGNYVKEPVLLQVDCRWGAYLEEYTGSKAEMELLLSRNNKLQVVGIDRNVVVGESKQKYTVIRVKQLPPKGVKP